MTVTHKLPLTHVDRVKKLRPELWGFLEQEIASLESKDWAGSVGSVDDIESKSYESCIAFLFNKIVKDEALQTGIPFEYYLDHFRQTQDALLLLQSLNQDYHNLLNFELAGKKTFSFSDNLTDNLLATELGADAEMVRPPFDSCLFVFSSPLAIDAAYQFIRKTPLPDDYRYPLSVFVTSLPDKSNPDFRKILMSVSHWTGMRLNFVIKREVAIRPGWKVDDALHTDWASLGEKGDGMFLSHDGESRGTSDEEFFTDGLTLFRLILNAILYLGSNEAEIVQKLSGREAALLEVNTIRSKAKAKKAKQEAQKESVLDYAAVGNSVQPIYVRKGGESGGSAALNSFRDFAIRFLVRGHWRNQACGPQMSERRIIWIKPYFKGPNMAELVNRPYVVL